MPRKPLPDKGVQTSLRLPRRLYDQLVEAAGEKGIGEEIRQRLERSFDETTGPDENTRKLLAQIAHFARVLERSYGPWHEDPFAAASLRRAVANLIGEVGKTEGDPEPKEPKPGSFIARARGIPGFDEKAPDVSKVAGLLVFLGGAEFLK